LTSFAWRYIVLQNEYNYSPRIEKINKQLALNIDRRP